MQDVVAGCGSLLLVGGKLHALYQRAVFMTSCLVDLVHKARQEIKRVFVATTCA